MAPAETRVALLPDAGPLITLAYAGALDLLFKPVWEVLLVDMVLHEVTRNPTPTSAKLARWVEDRGLAVLPSRTFSHYRETAPERKSNLGELAIQEAMNAFALETAPRTGVFLFEDHKIARAGFLLPDNCRKVSTRAFLLFLERQGWLESAAAIERAAILAGRTFSALGLPPE